MKTFYALAAPAVMAILVGYASIASAAAPAKVTAGVLTTPAGMTLYTYDNDTSGSGKSACTGRCAASWPPLLAQEGDKASGDYSIITRDDGKRQWAYKGKPLYMWASDQKPGDKKGDGIMNVWHVAIP